MSDQFADFIRRHAVVEGALEMPFELLGTVQCDQRRAGNKAAVALERCGRSHTSPNKTFLAVGR